MFNEQSLIEKKTMKYIFSTFLFELVTFTSNFI